MQKVILFVLGFFLFPSLVSADPGDIFQEQPDIFYSGVTGQTESYQKLGTTYTQNLGGVGFYLTEGGPTDVNIYMQECSDSDYDDCLSVTDTGTFSATTVDGNQESSSTFSSAYTLLTAKYYRLRIISAGHRLQCGDTSGNTPNAAGDATPNDACNGASRSWTYHLYEGGSPPASATSSLVVVDTSSDNTGIMIIGFLILGYGLFTLKLRK